MKKGFQKILVLLLTLSMFMSMMAAPGFADADATDPTETTAETKEMQDDMLKVLKSFEEELDSRRLPREFGEWRLKCGKRCITGGSCGLCRALRELADKLDKTDTVIIPKAKDKE